MVLRRCAGSRRLARRVGESRVSGDDLACERRLRPVGAGIVAVSPAGRLRCAPRGGGARQNSLRAARSVQTAGASQTTKRAARAAPTPAVLAATQRQPRRDAAPARRDGLAVGTNTVPRLFSWFGIVGPSRPRRCPRPASTRAGRSDANVTSGVPALLVVTDVETLERERASLTHARGVGAARLMPRVVLHDKYARALAGGSRLARRPAKRPVAGIVAASMARRCQTN